MARFHLAQVNAARMVAPLDDPQMADFVDSLERINELADESDGFVWRLQSDEGDATAIRAFDDDDILLNASIWESIDALRAYVYKSEHVDYLRRRREWFEPVEGLPVAAMWWIPAGEVFEAAEIPTRLRLLAQRGPSIDAFTFAKPFPPPD